MKVVLAETEVKGVTFKSLPVGAVFYESAGAGPFDPAGDVLHMKVRLDDGRSCTIDLEEGYETSVEDDDIVCPLNAKIVVEG